MQNHNQKTERTRLCLRATNLQTNKKKGIGTKMNKTRRKIGKKTTTMETEKLKGLRTFLREEEGMGTVEIILIIVVLIGLVIIFKTQLRALVQTVFEKITKDSNTVMS